MGFPTYVATATTQLLDPRLRELCLKRRQKNCKSEDQNISCETALSSYDREPAPTESQQYGYLEKTQTILATVDTPM